MAKEKSKKSYVILTFDIPVSFKVSISGKEEDEEKLNRIIKKRNIKNKSEYMIKLINRHLRSKAGIKDIQTFTKDYTSNYKKLKKEIIEGITEYLQENDENFSGVCSIIIKKENDATK